MDKLPTELVKHVLDLLDTPSLLSTICVNYLWYSVGTACLFSSITFYADPITSDLTFKSMQLLTQIYSEQDIRRAALPRIRLVQSVALLPSPQPHFRVTPHAFRTLNMIFFQLLRNPLVQSTLRAFEWRMGCLEELGRSPLHLPRHLRVLECVACQIDTSVLFPVLKKLSLRQMKDTDGEWVSRQIEHSNLIHLSVSGISSAESITMSSCGGLVEGCLLDLEYFGLEYVHIDVWPLPPSTRLRGFSMKYCSHMPGFYKICKQNLYMLETLTLVSEQDIRVRALNDFKRMLWSCRKLKTLVLLLAGRASNIPLGWIRPFHSTLEKLVLEARLFMITPTMSYKYSLEDMYMLASEMPHLKVLGLPIDIEQEVANDVCFYHTLPCLKLTYVVQVPFSPLKLHVLHLRNWLYPHHVTRTLDKLAKHLCRNWDQPCDAVLILANGQCYRVSDAASGLSGAHGAVPDAAQVDNALYRQHIISWI
jgi:hypothetical protein